MKRKKNKKYLLYSFLLGLVVLIVSGIIYINNDLPNTIFVNSNTSTRYDFSMPVSLSINGNEKISASGKNKINSIESGCYKGEYKLFGIFPLKEINVNVVDKTYVYPIGLPIGMYLKTQGVMVIDSGEFVDESGKSISPAEGIIRKGEYITQFNGVEVSNKAQLTYLIKENGGNTVTLTVKDEEGLHKVNITPQKSENGEYMLGIWVRDDSQGIGTLTYVTEEREYAALGHGISDIDTGKLLSSHDGSIYNANIWGIRKGKKGKPGGLCGTIIYNEENKIGSITNNLNSGLVGKLNANICKEYGIEKMEMAFHNEIKKGDAKIQIILDGKIEQYDIEIKEINKNVIEKNMVIEIVDEDLLKKTNGIVQGMSGSPILQEGKIVGAVTHVLVNDPTRGYGIFIENMLEH